MAERSRCARASAPAADAAPVPGDEQPGPAAVEAEQAADAQADVEQQSANPDPENAYNPATGSTHQLTDQH